MGLSVSASAGIVLIGIVLIFGTLYPAVDESQRLKNEARDEWNEWENDKKRSDLRIESIQISNQEDTIDITADNIGHTVLDVTELEIIIDGIYRTQNISKYVIDGEIENTTILNPKQNITITIENIGVEFDRIVIVNEFGEAFFYERGGE